MSTGTWRSPWRLLECLLAALLAMMVVLVFGNVVMRYAFNSGITVSEELARWLFVWLTFLGAVLALKENAHLGTDMLVSRLGARGRRALLVVALALMLGCCALLGAGSWQQVLINAEVLAPVSGLSMGLFYGAGLVFAIAAGAIVLGQLWRALSGRLADDALLLVQESEELGAAGLSAAPPKRG